MSEDDTKSIPAGATEDDVQPLYLPYNRQEQEAPEGEPHPSQEKMPERIPGESEGDAEKRGAASSDEQPQIGPRIEEGGTAWTPDNQGWPGDQPAQQNPLQDRPSGE